LATFAGFGAAVPRALREARFSKFRFIVAHYVAYQPNMISIGTSIFNVWDMNHF